MGNTDRRRPSALRDRYLPTLINMVCILVVIFLVELAVMHLLPLFFAGQTTLLTSLVDATLLTIFSAPILWLLVARPLESALLSEQSWGHALLGSVRDGVVVFDCQERIVMVNGAAERLFGRPARELVNRPITELVLLDATGSEEILSRPHDLHAAQDFLEATGRRQDGTTFPLEISVSHAEREQHPYFVGILRDVSHRRELEEEAARARNDREDVFTSITDAITIIDDRHLIVRTNPAAEQLLGVSRDALLNRNCFNLFHGFSHAPAHCQSCAVIETRVPSALEYFEPHLQRHLEVKALPRFDRAGQPAGLIHIMRDITERKAAEQELQQKNAELERFVYTVSHDLRTPLVTIKAFLGMFEQHLEDGAAGEVRSDLHYLHSAADRMSQLLEDLLELSRLGRIRSTPVRISSREVIADALVMAAGAIAERHVTVQVADAFVIFYGDRARLTEIWQNLIDNAVKYMGSQSAPRIEVGVSQGGKTPVFHVRDNGMGIEPRFHEKIFGIFEQLDPQAAGTGMGLALVKRIVEMHGGTIWVDSAGAGQGSCFSFTLPAALSGVVPEEAVR